MALTNTTFNAHKIKIYCCLGEYMEEYFTKRKYSIKDCSDMLANLTLAALLFKTICRFCLDDDDEHYTLDNEEIEKLVYYIESLLKI